MARQLILFFALHLHIRPKVEALGVDSGHSASYALLLGSVTLTSTSNSQRVGKQLVRD